MPRAALAVFLCAAACGKESIAVDKAPSSDYNHGALDAAVDKFVTAGRTPAAYAELARTITQLRPGMDQAVANEAELKLVVLALGPARSVIGKTIGERTAAMGLAVWPTLLQPRVEADALLATRDPKALQLIPLANEAIDAYLQRICGGPLAADCKHMVPEEQAAIVETIALHRATERTRNAVSECLMCSADPGWHEAVLNWEELDRAAEGAIGEVERRADPDNWPISGAAAEDDPGLPEAELSPRGDIMVGGHSYGPNQERLDVLRELRGTGTVIALHIHPETQLAAVRAILEDARKAGVQRVAVIAREPVYPWRRKAYWVADGSGLRANLRPTDTLQLLLHAIDEVAGPGTVARVD
jgi:hypothetical protein